MTATKGLEGIVATTSSISSIIDGVLTYRGIDIDDLAENATFEEVAYLLWYGKLPNQSELDRADAAAWRIRSGSCRRNGSFEAYPKNTNSMAALRTAVSSLALYDEAANDMTQRSESSQSDQAASTNPDGYRRFCAHS